MTRVANPQPRVALLGECMVELQPRPGGALVQAFGGDTLNVAVYLSRLLGDRAVIDYVTALGDDDLSQAMRARWREEGVSDAHARTLPGRLPGLYMIQTDDTGERRFLYWRGESAARQCFDGAEAEALLEHLARYDVIYLSGISLAILTEEGRARLLAGLKRCREQGVRIVFDNNYRPRLWRSVDEARLQHRAVLALTDVALITWEDDAQLFGVPSPDALFEMYAHLGVGEVALKRGSQPCLLSSSTGVEEVPAERVDTVVDTTAAGDAFSAAYLACRLIGGPAALAARWGHRLAGTVIGHPGALVPRDAMPVMPALSSPLSPACLPAAEA
jgi:2-dehydro-3-deoxygluconokinase